MHYKTHCCGTDQPAIQLNKKDDAGLSRLIEKYIRELFEDRKVSEANQAALWKHYYNTLAKGLDIGFSPNAEQYDPKLALDLKYNIAEFSAFKETSFRKQLEAALTKNGAIVPWSEFKKNADALNIEYNRRWLKAEYSHTLATANMVDKWQSIKADADLYPNAKYLTVNDNRVRDAHKSWNGLVLPINHPFWDNHLPPNDWGCRCDVIGVDEEVSPDIPNLQAKTEFNNNAAESGKVFADIPYKKTLSIDDIEKVAIISSNMMKAKIYNPVVINEFKSGGKILQSGLVNTELSDYLDVKKCCEYFAKKGSITEVLPTVDFENPLYKEIFGDLIGTKFERKCPDFKVDGLFYELEGFEGEVKANKISNMLSRGLKQSARIVLKDDGSTLNHTKKIINFSKKEGKLIKEVWIYRENGALEQVY